MYAAVRTTGRATKSGGAMGEFNKARRGDAVAESRGGEFQVVGSAELEKMVRGPQGTAEI